jgi:hypothetical protein
MGDTRHGKSPTVLNGCLGRYSGMHKSRYTRLTSAFAPHEHGHGRDCSLVMPAIDTFACEAVTVPNWLFGDRPLQKCEGSGRSARDRACHCLVLHFASRLQM